MIRLTRPRAARWAAIGLGLLALATLLAIGQAGPLWRSLYPHLPARAQALPYRLREALPGLRQAPRPLPTPPPAALAGGAGPRVGQASAAPATAPTVAGPAPPAGATAIATAALRAPATARAGDAAIAPPVPVSPSPVPLPPAVEALAVRHAYQHWNNCGPVTVAMALSAFGDTVDQTVAASVLKPDPDDKNVGPEELAAFARGRGFGALARVNGDIQGLKALTAAGLPVIVETWFIPKPGDEMGHYRLVTGYSDAAGIFHTADSYEGPRVDLPYEDLDRLWRVFNRGYVVVYPLEREAVVERILGADLDDATMFRGGQARAIAELAAEEDVFGWFNLGSSLVGLGDMAGAAGAFDRARALGLPWRMLWYQFGPFEAYGALGRWEDVAALARANLANAGNLEESLYWRGRAREAAGDRVAAAADYRRALDLNAGFAPATAALEALP